VDASDPADAAVDAALELAHAEGSTLCFCHVIDVKETLLRAAKDGQDAAPILHEMRDQASALLAAAVSRAHAQQITTRTRIVEEAPIEGILQAARAEEASAIVIGTHGRRGIRRLILGSVAEGVVRHAELPVLVTPTRPPLPLANLALSGEAVQHRS